ncbi:methionyl-tRNA formyltransferase [Sediminibacterium sp. C3]|uniref:methionyl-tRNA formyltransferase n=1 Tax=Sediminibacterium sp. C3 TaxID=1267211 RepID=UPI0003F6DD54|nr:methionyl-tRNA formyltransferase [Sediminibacterium sp. C3]
MKKNFIILSEKKWHKELFYRLQREFINCNWVLIDEKSNFKFSELDNIKPDKIFIPHWSYIIPDEIFNNFECIVFHMTDLPFGRGGSPLQNLIVRGFKSTKISAIKVQSGIDSGDVYLKRDLNLEGSAKEIFEKSASIIEDMIREIVLTNCTPSPQIGHVVEFKRRRPEDSDIANLSELDKIYDYIRMLDCEGYPNAFIEFSNLRFEFTDAIFDTNNNFITANVRISKK